MKEPSQPAWELFAMVIVSPATKLVRLKPAWSSQTAPVEPELGTDELGVQKIMGTATPVAEAGTVPGAVYRPAALMVPTVAFPLAMPLTLHCMALLDPVSLGIN